LIDNGSRHAPPLRRKPPREGRFNGIKKGKYWIIVEIVNTINAIVKLILHFL